MGAATSVEIAHAGRVLVRVQEAHRAGRGRQVVMVARPHQIGFLRPGHAIDVQRRAADRVRARHVGHGLAHLHGLPGHAAEEAPVRQRVGDLGIVLGVDGRLLHDRGRIGVVGQDQRARLLDQRAARGGARLEGLVEARETLGEVHLDRELLVRRRQHRLVEGVQRFLGFCGTQGEKDRTLISLWVRSNSYRRIRPLPPW